MAAHVGDDPAAVAANRRDLRQQLQLPAEPAWLNQVHGCAVIRAGQTGAATADASWTQVPGSICAVLTADCLPLLLCDRDGGCIAAVHVGWRGLVAGVIQAAVASLPVEPGRLLAWLGPCIGPGAFEVGAEVYAACQQTLPGADAGFHDGRPGRWQADLPALTRLALKQAGLIACYDSELCTYSQPQDFYSYRRDGRTGRMAALIWMDATPT
ncbi:MAG: peptidoglycan editing factor PgeF [Gammaproteobacteria bacterium]|nr:peptidoglycan editing factor PgeF [Gammaproteobacteria bacterium]